MARFSKYTYWLEKDRFQELQEEMTSQGRSLHAAKRAVCVPLAKGIEAGYVPADGWQGYSLCRRQLSWQAGSIQAGRTLVVTSQPLEGLVPETIISQPQKFKPPSLPDRDQMLDMIARPSYQQARPEIWEDLSAEDPAQQERWLKLMGLRNVTFAELFIIHRANHANFIEPAYYLEENGDVIPYSIAKTSGVCSACLEFYGILGAGYQRRLVVPCPGAVIFAGMAPNRYYEVIRPKQKADPQGS
jgi:hypothetical protein